VTLAILCALSEYSTSMTTIVMLSQDEYLGTLCPLPVIHYILRATILVNLTSVGHITPSPYSSAKLYQNWCFSTPALVLNGLAILNVILHEIISHSAHFWRVRYSPILTICIGATPLDFVPHNPHLALLYSDQFILNPTSTPVNHSTFLILLF